MIRLYRNFTSAQVLHSVILVLAISKFVKGPYPSPESAQCCCLVFDNLKHMRIPPSVHIFHLLIIIIVQAIYICYTICPYTRADRIQIGGDQCEAIS
jgi:hypothetical protein